MEAGDAWSPKGTDWEADRVTGERWLTGQDAHPSWLESAFRTALPEDRTTAVRGDDPHHELLSQPLDASDHLALAAIEVPTGGTRATVERRQRNSAGVPPGDFADQ